MTYSIGMMQKINEERARRWHNGGIHDWSVSDWGVALAGEVGECCNAIKKWNRLRDGIANVNDADRQIRDNKEAVDKIGEELADTVHYAMLLASRLGINLEQALIDKFNKVSEKYNFPERM